MKLKILFLIAMTFSMNAYSFVSTCSIDSEKCPEENSIRISLFGWSGAYDGACVKRVLLSVGGISEKCCITPEVCGNDQLTCEHPGNQDPICHEFPDGGLKNCTTDDLGR